MDDNAAMIARYDEQQALIADSARAFAQERGVRLVVHENDLKPVEEQVEALVGLIAGDLA